MNTFETRIIQILLENEASLNDSSSTPGHYEWKMETRAGTLLVHISVESITPRKINYAIFTRFLEPEKAKQFLGEAVSDAGKWNFHYGIMSKDSIPEMVKAFYYKLRPVLMDPASFSI